MKTKNTRKGFTTVELVIVIAVIAILATVLIPTFSNMIEKANISADTQNVRNMNMVLMTYITDGEPEHFGVVRQRLLDGGYKTGEEFVPKTKGYRYLWYAKDNVVLLVNRENKVVFPEGYESLSEQVDTEYYDEEYLERYDTPITTLTNVYKCFDLSLPAALVEKETNATAIFTSEEDKTLFYVGNGILPGVFTCFDMYNDGTIGEPYLRDIIATQDAPTQEKLNAAMEHLSDYCTKVNAIAANAELDNNQKALEKQKVQAAIVRKVVDVDTPLAVKYTFTTGDTIGTKYDDWTATFLVSVDMPHCNGVGCECRQADKEQHKVSFDLAGFYEAWCYPHNYGDWRTLRIDHITEGVTVDLLKALDYNMQNITLSEACKLIDVFECGVLDNGSNTGTELTVELRITNKRNTEEIKVIGVFHYTFK